MTLTKEQEQELKELKEWKRLYDLPNHQEVQDDKILVASIGMLFGPDDPRSKYMAATNHKQLGYLGNLPLVIISKTKDGNFIDCIVNKRYEERHLFHEYLLVKRGMLPKEYLNAYVGAVE